MQGCYLLANSFWPRTGYDRANTARVPFEGPTGGVLRWEVFVPDGADGPGLPTRALVVVPDGSLRVASGGRVVAVSPEGMVLWSRLITGVVARHSAPVACSDGLVLLTAGDRLMSVDPSGRVEVLARSGSPFSDDGLSPNITTSGEVILSSMMGEVWAFRQGALLELGVLGYDVPPPALYLDGSLAVSGYAGQGCCRVSACGRILWSGAENSDTVPTINHGQRVAVGLLNQGCSIVYGPEGREEFRYPAPALFSVCDDDGWVAFSDGLVARLDPVGRVLWSVEVDAARDWGACQAVIDVLGRIYLGCRGGLIALEPNGDLIFRTRFDCDQPNAVAPIAPGLMGLVVPGRLIVVA